ncbi:hypothetical protein [Curtobacterium sp. AG1037]|uniref:hypothetical protein n=1 Tax=Curtobacterium sp. AG1037 TaxID=2183990 RepID=UPI0015F1225B|nr:hypothetical protein [Curtobacterium sp. AG1037]
MSMADAAALDGFIAAVGGDDPVYTGQWPRVEWQAAYNAFQAFTRGPAGWRLAPFAGMPEWLRQMVDGRAVPDTETPAPTLGRLWTERLNWFQVVDEHPADLVLWVDRPAQGHQVSAQQLRAAFDAVHAVGATPVLTVHLDPAIESEDLRTTVSIEALYVVDMVGTMGADVAAAILGWPGAEPYHFEQPSDVLNGAGLQHGHVTAWEWL